MSERTPKHTEARQFSRKEINWHRSSLPPGSARMILGIAPEHMGQPTVEISEDKIANAKKRDIKKDIKGESFAAIVHTVSDAERPHVAAENIDEAGDTWVNQMADYLQDRTKISGEAAKILNKKFDLDLDVSQTTYTDRHASRKNTIVKNRVEVQLWKAYFSGEKTAAEGKGTADFDAFIKDLVKNDSYTTIVANLKTIRPFLGIFGGETTIRQLEDAILAYAALQTTKPFSRERMHLIDYAVQTAKYAENSQIDHYLSDAAGKDWKEDRWLPHSWTHGEVEHARRLKFAIAVEKGQSEEASWTTVELGSKNWFKFAGAQQVTPEVLDAYLSPDQKADVDRQLKVLKEDTDKHGKGIVYVKDAEGDVEYTLFVTENKDKPDELEFYQIMMRGKDLPYFSENGKLYHITPVKGKPYWAWYQYNDPIERQRIDQEVAEKQREEQEAQRKALAARAMFERRVESLRNEGWEPVAPGGEVDLPKLDMVIQQLPTSEQETIKAKMTEAAAKVQDARAEKGYEFFQFRGPAEDDTRGSIFTLAYIRRFNNEPVLVVFNPDAVGENFNPEKARIFVEGGQYELWQMKEQLTADDQPATPSTNNFGQDGQRRTGLA